MLWGGRFSVSSMLLGRHLRGGGWEKVEHRLVWWGWANGGDVALYYPSCFIAMARIGQHTYRIQQCINTGTWHVRSPTEIKARASWPLDL